MKIRKEDRERKYMVGGDRDRSHTFEAMTGTET